MRYLDAIASRPQQKKVPIESHSQRFELDTLFLAGLLIVISAEKVIIMIIEITERKLRGEPNTKTDATAVKTT